ncbi:MAG: hypothetical protein HYS17_00480 [Micavibrio aeruginosavorus]|uniref:SGNH hydrolase-type esterase domain-containing protein n=1 Tax=Micavibrio aeruginosavorus TaxID=349221 RepID=A0A7T5UI41_9BACT|nr:MAG: hypothetical protein HYS17_00480 [Micavibrio aeruginosavorus]
MITGFLVCEAGLQVIARTPLAKVLPLVEPQLGQPDPDTGYEFVPGIKAVWSRENRAIVEINEIGLRDSPLIHNGKNDSYRIVLSGDSIVEALQVENDRVFDYLAEVEMRRNGHDVEILNFGISGSGPLRQLVRLEKKAAPLSPDLTIMLIAASDFISGELRDDSEGPAYALNPEGQVVRSHAFRHRASQRYAGTGAGKVFLALLRHSHVFRMIYQKRRGTLLALAGLPDFKRPQAATTNTADACQTETFKRQHEFWVGHHPAEDWQILQRFLTETAIYAAHHNIAIGLYLPLATDSCLPEQKRREEAVAAITRTLALHKIDFIDWNSAVYDQLSATTAAPATDSLHGFGSGIGTGHLNYRGHDIYARILAKEIKRRLEKDGL